MLKKQNSLIISNSDECNSDLENENSIEIKSANE
jgi:hypothetical protein